MPSTDIDTPPPSEKGQSNGPAAGHSNGPAVGQSNGPAVGQSNGSASGQSNGPVIGESNGPSICESDVDVVGAGGDSNEPVVMKKAVFSLPPSGSNGGGDMKSPGCRDPADPGDGNTAVGGGGLRARRASECTLRIMTSPGEVRSADDTKEEGRELFENFVREEIQRAGLEEPECLTPVPPPIPAPVDNAPPAAVSFTLPREPERHTHTSSTLQVPGAGAAGPAGAAGEGYSGDSRRISTPSGFKNPMWANTGRELREMADEFEKTEERKIVRQRANAIDLDSINYREFSAMLYELFVDGNITRQRIIVLFTFCSDVAIRALKLKAMHYFKQFLQWSLRYIVDKVCAWVEEHGGWESVIRHTSQPLVMLACGLAVGVLVGLAAMWYLTRGRDPGPPAPPQ